MESIQDDTAKKIIAAAVPLFADKGYKGVSVREILQAAEVGNSGAISYYFGGKRELYIAILREHFQHAHQLAEAINQNEWSPVKKLKLIFAAIGETYKNSPYTIKLLLREINQPGEFFSEIDAEIKSVQKISYDIIREGIEAEIFRADVKPECITLFLFSTAHFAFIMSNLAEALLNEETFDEYFAQAQKMFFGGIMC